MDRKTFLANVRRSGLLSEEELRALKKRLPRTYRGRVVARALVRLGVLTKFQAELLLAGRTQGFLVGQYRILDHLGEGGMGRVFKALHQAMNRVVALKVLAPHLVKTEKAQRLFQREVRAAAQLIHPNVVTAYDANQVEGRHYLVMEYVDGPNLDQLVCWQGPLPVGLACDLVRQVADALQYAYETGLVHRDLKPSNILVQPARTPGRGSVAKVLDFGLACLHQGEPAPDSPSGRKNTVLGTPDFISPEQARNQTSANIRSDLYSLGCTLYFLLTGKVPFPGGSTAEKVVRHCLEEPVPVEQHRPDLPAPVAAVVRRLMAKDPRDRFQTPAELAAALAPHAVPGPASWGPRRTAPLSDELDVATPSESFAALDGTDGLPDNRSALAGTVGPAGVTPVSASDVPLIEILRDRPRPWGKMLLLTAAGLVAAGAGTAVWLLLP
jgi:serine/threonine protein kinase